MPRHIWCICGCAAFPGVRCCAACMTRYWKRVTTLTPRSHSPEEVSLKALRQARGENDGARLRLNEVLAKDNH